MVTSGVVTEKVFVPPIATGSVPVLVPDTKLIFENAVVARLIVLPLVAAPAISAVMKMYPVEPLLINCVVKVGKTCDPAPKAVVFVLNVASAPSNVASAE